MSPGDGPSTYPHGPSHFPCRGYDDLGVRPEALHAQADEVAKQEELQKLGNHDGPSRDVKIRILWRQLRVAREPENDHQHPGEEDDEDVMGDAAVHLASALLHEVK